MVESGLMSQPVPSVISAGDSSIKVEMPTGLGNYINGIELFEMA